MLLNNYTFNLDGDDDMMKDGEDMDGDMEKKDMEGMEEGGDDMKDEGAM